jgi:hypothetical protein
MLVFARQKWTAGADVVKTLGLTVPVYGKS